MCYLTKTFRFLTFRSGHGADYTQVFMGYNVFTLEIGNWICQ